MIPSSRALSKFSQIAGTMLLSLSCCACASSRTVARSNSPDDVLIPSAPVAKNNQPKAVASYEEPGTIRLGKKSSSPSQTKSQPPTVASTRHDSQIRTIGYDNSVTQTNGAVETPFSIQSCPPEPRWAAPCPDPNAQGMVGCLCESSVLPEKYPDEYLCDGGDRGLPVSYDDLNRNGLETEDTIAEYIDHKGKNRVRPTNKVCIYAPRFSAVRTVSRPHEDSNLFKIADVDHASGTSGFHSRMKPSHHTKQESTGRMAMRSRASGLESEQLQGDISQTKRLAVHDKLINVYQDLAFVQFGKAEHTDAARLNYGIKAAMLWTREEYPVIGGKTDSAMTGVSDVHTATIVGVDDKKSDEVGELRIVKLADKDTAVPGDVIEFTLRYDNLGANPVHHVRIVDNLTPRLQYVDDSATSDREGRLVVQDNSEGSVILIWELTEPLAPKTGGVVTFKAKVR